MAIGDPFMKQFNPARGDIVYGRSDYRLPYLKDAKANFGDCWLIIDDYNNASVLSARGEYVKDRKDDQQRVLGHVTAAAQQFQKDPNPARPVSNYLDDIYKHPKYSPDRAIHAREDRLSKEHGEAYDEDAVTDANIQWVIIRRACKFGIEWVVENTGTQSEIHFVIDGLDMAEITTKKALKTTGRVEPAVPITTSELCSIYRKWHRPGYKHRIRFYLNQLETEPPWENKKTSNVWEVYGKARFDKYYLEYSKKLEGALFNPRNFENKTPIKAEADFKNAVAAGLRQLNTAIAGFVSQKQYYAATDYIKTKIETLDPAWRTKSL